jgi:hypothetical protein
MVLTRRTAIPDRPTCPQCDAYPCTCARRLTSRGVLRQKLGIAGLLRPPSPLPLLTTLPMRNIDVVVKFEDGSEAVLLAQARHPLRAVNAVISEAERTLDAERLLGVRSVEFRR